MSSDKDRVYLVSAPVDLSPPVDLRHWLQVIMQRKWIIAAATLLVGLAGLASSFLISPVYRSSIVVSPVTEDGSRGLSGLTSQLGGISIPGLNLGGSDLRRNEAIAVLRSRVLVEQLIIAEELLPVLYTASWDADSGDWLVEGADVPTLEDAYKKFDQEIRSVNEDTSTGLVILSIEWSDPAIAADWAAKLVSRADSRLRATAIDEAQSSIQFLEAELATTSVLALQQVMTRLIESQINNITLANSRREYAFRIIDPPMVSDRDHFVWPDRGFLLRTGLALGFLLGLAWVIFSASAGRAREE